MKDLTPIFNAVSIDIIDPLDGADSSAVLGLSNDNGDSVTLIIGSQDNNSVLFAEVYDPLHTFSSITIFSTKLPGDAVFIDSAQFNTVVPIPSAFWLLGSGLIGLLGFGGMRVRKS